MIYMEPSTLGWRPLVKSWMNKLPSTLNEMHRSVINDMFERFVDAGLQLVHKAGVKVSQSSNLGLGNLVDKWSDLVKICCVKR